ncbi:MAG: transglutaminase domain-containing protein [Archangium sp.]
MLRFVWLCSLLAVTGLGVWLASSLVAFAGGPAALACVGGVLLFPVLPLWWEKRASDAFYAQLRRSRRLLPKKRALTAGTRIALRTVFINLVFIAVLLVVWPKVALAALATRGDWFLGENKGPWVDRTREALVVASSGLEWLHEAANDNPYRTKQDEQAPVPEDVKPVETVETKFGSGERWRRADPIVPTPKPEPMKEEPPPPPLENPDAVYAVGQTSWPWKEEVDPIVTGMNASDESSPEAVARYLSSRTTDPFHRVKLLHDWVVTRITYDHASVTGVRKPQDARSVFTSRLGVCEGYARLLVELGRLTGDRIVYVTGDVRNDDGSPVPVGHAWNAVEVKGAWYLMDATWDDEQSSEGNEVYATDYLFIPPELAGLDHFPDEPRWQLREKPITRAAFLRQALARPGFAKERLTLHSPERMAVDVNDSFSLRVDNPANAWLLLHIGEQVCGPVNDASVALDCPVPKGAKTAVLFSNKDRDGTYDDVAIFTLR